MTIPGLDPRVSYLVSHGVGHLLVPLFEAWLVIRLLRFAAGKVCTVDVLCGFLCVFRGLQ